MYFIISKYFVSKRPQTTYAGGEELMIHFAKTHLTFFLETLHFFRNLTFFSIKHVTSTQKSINFDELEQSNFVSKFKKMQFLIVFIKQLVFNVLMKNETLHFFLPQKNVRKNVRKM